MNKNIKNVLIFLGASGAIFTITYLSYLGIRKIKIINAYNTTSTEQDVIKIIDKKTIDIDDEMEEDEVIKNSEIESKGVGMYL